MSLGELVEARLVERHNRFPAGVKLGDEEERVYLPNPGRLEVLLHPGARVFPRKAPGPGRVTRWDLMAVYCEAGWVCTDSRVPNLLFAEGISCIYRFKFRCPPPVSDQDYCESCGVL